MYDFSFCQAWMGQTQLVSSFGEGDVWDFWDFNIQCVHTMYLIHYCTFLITG